VNQGCRRSSTRLAGMFMVYVDTYGPAVAQKEFTVPTGRIEQALAWIRDNPPDQGLRHLWGREELPESLL
jgi:hypothetical protein